MLWSCLPRRAPHGHIAYDNKSVYPRTTLPSSVRYCVVIVVEPASRAPIALKGAGRLVCRATINLGGVDSPDEHEREVLAYLVRAHGRAPEGQIWAGDDAAVLAPLLRPLITTDLVVEGVHVDRRFCAFVDMGFKSVSVNVSDIAAMGGVPRAILIAIAGATGAEIRQIMHGAQEAAALYGCDIVGGDITDGATLVIAATAIGEGGHEPLLRSGARPGDIVYVTGPLGASSMGLRELTRDSSSTGSNVDAYRRPVARVGEGLLLGELGAHAAVDCSDGLANALYLLAECSGVKIALESLPGADGATNEDVLEGGEDYELVFCLPGDTAVAGSFVERGLRVPIRVGSVMAGTASVDFAGRPLASRGFSHTLGAVR